MIAIVVAVVLVAGVGAFFLLRGGGDGEPGHDGTGSPLPSPGEQTPEFHFKLRSTKVIPVVTGKKKSSGAKDDVAEVKDRLSTMYALAFLDPTRWQPGDYETVYGFFSLGDTAASAKRDTEVLTLGANAGDTFESVKPKYGALVVRVLTDKTGVPFTISAKADFTAIGDQKNGKTMVIKSHATYILQSGEGGWVIVGYKAKRTDHAGGAAPTPKTSGTGGSG
ncbi:MAG TPA: hypothetical protein VGB19_08050 [Actinomycetota bacterium]